jgi:hypothetical protein
MSQELSLHILNLKLTVRAKYRFYTLSFTADRRTRQQTTTVNAFYTSIYVPHRKQKKVYQCGVKQVILSIATRTHQNLSRRFFCKIQQVLLWELQMHHYNIYTRDGISKSKYIAEIRSWCIGHRDFGVGWFLLSAFYQETKTTK